MAKAVKGGVGGIRAVVCGAIVASLAAVAARTTAAYRASARAAAAATTPRPARAAPSGWLAPGAIGTGAAGTGGDGTGTAGTGGATGTTGTGGATGTAGAGGGYVPPAGVVWTVDGGDAASGRASGGGAIHVVARGAVTLGASPTPPPPVSTPPADAIVVDGAALGADVAVAGSIRLDGTLTAGGGDAVRQITSAGGDVFVSGTLRGGEVGRRVARPVAERAAGHRLCHRRHRHGGTQRGPGRRSIVITGQRVVVLGSLSANGADGDVGGSGGPITIAAADLVFVGGPVSLRGGVGTYHRRFGRYA